MTLEEWQIRDINSLTRKEITDIMRDYSFECYDSETTEMLREALIVNIQDGTIPFCDVAMLF